MSCNDRECLEALSVAEARFRCLVEAAPHIVFEIDADGRARYLNRLWVEYTGGEPDAGVDLARGVHPEDQARLLAAWTAAERWQAKFDCEYRVRRHDGQYRWFSAHALPVRDPSGKVTHWLGTATDVHDVKLVRQATLDAERRKTELLGVLSHELGNPLSPIKSSLYILGRATPGGNQARRAMEVIERQVDQLTRLVDDLLDVTQISRGSIQLQRRRVDLNELARRSVEEHRTMYECCEVRLDLEPFAEPVLVDADRNRIAQVLRNLLHNAAKFTSSRGRVRVSVGRDAEASQAVVRVEDTGIGIAPEMLGKIFEPFAQTEVTQDRRRGGLGLGLALVRGLVEQHGGSVEAQSAGARCGTAVTVRLPLDTGGPATEEQARAQGSLAPRRILVIEDNVDAAESLRDFLELEGHEVDIAYDGVEGIAKARKTRPDLVLCDIGLPEMNGFEVARELRADEALGGVYLVALSGYALPRDLERAAEAGFDRHIAKPPSIQKILELLRTTR